MSWSLPPDFDRRLTPARPDLAALSLRGRVEARRFVEGEAAVVRVGVLDLKREPRPDAPLDTQVLYGERVTVFDEDEGWAWVQCERDGYVGYAAATGLAAPGARSTHRVVVRRAHVYPAPDMKQPVLRALPLDARVTVEGERGTFSRIEGFGWMVSAHLAPDTRTVPDMVSVAEALVGTPYLWGGRTALGIDCSGLVQLAASMAGHRLPRDTDLQQGCGEAVADMVDLGRLRRGDLVFWRGHVGLMADAGSLVHANAFHMLVAQEPLEDARIRIAAAGQAITALRRLPPNV